VNIIVYKKQVWWFFH